MNVVQAGKTCYSSSCNNCNSSYLAMIAVCVAVAVAVAVSVAVVHWALFTCFIAEMKLNSTRAFLMRIYMF